MKEIKFSHHYDKLDDREFTTIRGKSHFHRYNPGEVVNIVFDGEILGTAEITKMKLVAIKDISLSLLKKDVAINKITIKSYNAFINFINRLRKRHPIETDEEPVTIFWLKWE